jgi:methionine-rich copper-binding protein CopC
MAQRIPYRRAVGAVLLALTVSLASVGLASAHASLVSANIKPGQVFAHDAYPRTLIAVFADNVTPQGSWLHVFEADPAGDHGLVDRNDVRFPVRNPREITVGLPSNLKGTYTVMWFTQSADDGHEAGSAFTFTVK